MFFPRIVVPALAALMLPAAASAATTAFVRGEFEVSFSAEPSEELLFIVEPFTDGPDEAIIGDAFVDFADAFAFAGPDAGTFGTFDTDTLVTDGGIEGSISAPGGAFGSVSFSAEAGASFAFRNFGSTVETVSLELRYGLVAEATSTLAAGDDALSRVVIELFGPEDVLFEDTVRADADAFDAGGIDAVADTGLFAFDFLIEPGETLLFGVLIDADAVAEADVAAVPLPASVWLMLTGLLGIRAVRKRMV